MLRRTGQPQTVTSADPLTSISTRAQVERSRSNDSLIKAVRKAIEKDGVASLFDGLSSSIFAIAVTNAVYYGALWVALVFPSPYTYVIMTHIKH